MQYIKDKDITDTSNNMSEKMMEIINYINNYDKNNDDNSHDDIEPNTNEHVMNITKNNKYVAININNISEVLSAKTNNMLPINDNLIKELCIGLMLHCHEHNKNIREWFNDEYQIDLSRLKKNNEEYSKLFNKYMMDSPIFIE